MNARRLIIRSPRRRVRAGTTGIVCGETFATCGTGTEFIQTIYAQRDAIFRGGEVARQWDLVPVATGIFGVDGHYDFVRATFAAGGSNVPRKACMPDWESLA